MLRWILHSPIVHFFRAHPKRAAMLFFAALFVLGAVCVRQYGVPYDEGTMDSLAHDSYSYVFRGGEWPTTNAWRYHGTFVELPLYALEEWASPADHPATIYKRVFVRHFFGAFLFLFLSTLVVFAHARRQFKTIWWGLLGALLFLLLPRIFAHGFYNTRDIPQIALFGLAMLTLLKLLDTRTISSAFLHGLAIAMALALRMSALILVPITMGFLILEYLRADEHADTMPFFSYVTLGAVTMLTTVFAVWAFWPFLWSAPIAHFLEAYRFMSSLGSNVVFLGKTYEHLPWLYVPVWIAVTIPPVTLLLCVTGVITSAIGIWLQARKLNAEARDRLLYLCWLILPVLAIHLSGAGIYLEWRHVFFLAPAIILLALMGLKDLLDWSAPKKWIHGGLIGIVTLQIGVTGFWMIRNHPHEFMYYSIPLKTAVPMFLDDYWALSYRTAARAALDLQPTGIITMYSDENVAFQNMYTVYPESLARVMRVPTIAEASLVLTRSKDIAKDLEPLKLIQVDGVTINGVYKGGAYTKQ